MLMQAQMLAPGNGHHLPFGITFEKTVTQVLDALSAKRKAVEASRSDRMKALGAHEALVAWCAARMAAQQANCCDPQYSPIPIRLSSNVRKAVMTAMAALIEQDLIAILDFGHDQLNAERDKQRTMLLTTHDMHLFMPYDSRVIERQAVMSVASFAVQDAAEYDAVDGLPARIPYPDRLGREGPVVRSGFERYPRARAIATVDELLQTEV